MGYKLENLVGKRFGMLTVEENMPSVQYGSTKKRRWLCTCDCGKQTEVDTGQLTSGNTKSCGCLHKISSANNGRKSRNKVAKRDAIFNVAKSMYRGNAKRRGLAWNLEDDHVIKLLSSDCYYCGLPPSNLYKTTYYEQRYSGIDRLNNKFGYEKSNVVSCCSVCNHAKHTMSENDFMVWLGRVFTHQSRLIEEMDKTK